MNSTLCFIGGGNMARSLIGGLIARGMDAQRITVADPLPATLEALREQFGVQVTPHNTLAAQSADVVVLAVKPQEMPRVTPELAEIIGRGAPLIISVAAGIRAGDIQRWSGGGAVVRCMPNRPALQGCGMTGLFATAEVSAAQRRLAVDLLGAVGNTVWVDQEAQLDAVTAISGSGPAYFFLLIEILEQTGVTLGLSAEVSRCLAVETAYGAGCMAKQAPESAASLREQVTSKGGTTEAALQHLEANGVRGIFAAAVTAAARRSAELAEQFGAR